MVKHGSSHKINKHTEIQRSANIKTIIDMAHPLMGMKGLNYASLAKETMQLVDQFFDSEPRVIESLLRGQTEVYYWKLNDYALTSVKFLIRGRWLHLKVEASICDLWKHFPPDVLNLSLLAAKICIFYHQHVDVKLQLGRLDFQIKYCFISTEDAHTLHTALKNPPLSTSPLLLEPYYQAPPKGGWERLIMDLKKGEESIHTTGIWNIRGSNGT